jgi:hypothetical protein
VGGVGEDGYATAERRQSARRRGRKEGKYHSAHMSMLRRWIDTRFISRIVTLMKPEKVRLPSDRTLCPPMNRSPQLIGIKWKEEPLTNYPTPPK